MPEQQDQEKEFVREITPQGTDFAQWYTDVVMKAELVDYGPVRGTMVIKPYGFALWENIQQRLDRRIKDTGHQNAYFPLFIPESLLQKEVEHVEGFAPEVAWVTRGGQEDLGERLAVRPTSETIICQMYSKWIQSWRDLPVLINQWANVVRWEKATRPFLRTLEFLWQEGHTAHRTEEEAEEETLKMLGVYREFMETELALPVVVGRKSEAEKFAGALRTYTLESLMADGRALQAGTSHNLGQHFARVFDILFLDEDDQLKHVWQTSWGVSTRLIGALVMCHGDDRGLVLPPAVAPHQVVIVPIPRKGDWEHILPHARAVETELKGAGLRVHTDVRPQYTPGWKFNEWEMRGVPVRLEIGPRDVEKNQVVLARRDTGEKSFVPRTDLAAEVRSLLDSVQEGIYRRAAARMVEMTAFSGNFEDFKEIMADRRGFIRAPWCGDSACEASVKSDTGATIRCIPLEAGAITGDPAGAAAGTGAAQAEATGGPETGEAPDDGPAIPAGLNGPVGPGSGRCLVCDREAKHLAYFARAY